VDGTGEGDILAWRLTSGTVAARHPVPELAHRLFGKLLGDTGYLPQDLLARLCQQGVELLTPLRTHRKPRPLKLHDQLLLRERVLIEPIQGVAK
jgi:hypothetical protein